MRPQSSFQRPRDPLQVLALSGGSRKVQRHWTQAALQDAVGASFPAQWHHDILYRTATFVSKKIIRKKILKAEQRVNSFSLLWKANYKLRGIFKEGTCQLPSWSFHLIGEKNHGNPVAQIGPLGLSTGCKGCLPPSSNIALGQHFQWYQRAHMGAQKDVGMMLCYQDTHLSAYTYSPGISAGSWHTHHTTDQPSVGSPTSLVLERSVSKLYTSLMHCHWQWMPIKQLLGLTQLSSSESFISAFGVLIIQQCS